MVYIFNFVKWLAGFSSTIYLNNIFPHRDLLIVLDNFEHVLAAAPLVAVLLADSSHLKILVTSRAPLRVTGEHVRRVSSLNVPSGNALPIEELMASPVVQLFAAYAREVDPSFEVAPSNVKAIAGICYQLDGLPLAIELAAARCSLFSPGEMLPRLARRLPFLTSGKRDAPTRHQTMRHAISWSYDLLGQSEKEVFRRLSVFVGGVSLDISESFIDDIESGSLETLASLADHQLISRVGGIQNASRFTMLETIREFALEKLIECGEETSARDRHAFCLLGFAQDVELGRCSLRPQVESGRLQDDRSNFLAALDWHRKQGDVNAAMRMAGALWPLWLEHGAITEGRTVLEAILGMPSEEHEQTVRAKAIWVAGALAQAQGDHTRAMVLTHVALDICRAIGDEKVVASALITLGLDAMVRGDHAQATQCMEKARTLFHETQDLRAATWAQRHLGSLAIFKGNPLRAQTLAEDGLEIARTFGHPEDIARLLHTLGGALAQQAHYERANRAWDEALQYFIDSDDRWGEADVQSSLGALAIEVGEARDAKLLLEESLSSFKAVDDPYGIARVLGSLGELARRQGSLGEAAQLFETGLAIANEHNDQLGLAELMVGSGEVARDTGDFVVARARFRSARLIASSNGLFGILVRAIEQFVLLTSVRTNVELAATILGACESHRDVQSLVLPPTARIQMQQFIDQLRAQISEVDFEGAWNRGIATPIGDEILHLIDRLVFDLPIEC